MTGSRGAESPLEELFSELIGHQEQRLRELAARLMRGPVCLDDLLCPDDVPALRRDPDFLYEHGVLAGLLAAQSAVRALAGAGPESAAEEKR
jgi:hypothetical protein